MDHELERFKAELELADDHLEEYKLRAKRTLVPKNPNTWLDDLERIALGEIARLPIELQAEFEELMQSQIRQARKVIKRWGDESKHLPMILSVLKENLDRIRANTDMKTANSTELGRSMGGATTREIRKSEKESNIAEAVRIWHELAKAGRAKRERCAIIARRMGGKDDTVRRWIKEAGLR